MFNIKEHLHLIKRNKLEDFYQIVRNTYFKQKKKTTSAEILNFLNDEVKKNRIYTWCILLELLDKDFFENSRENFYKISKFLNEEELSIMDKKGVFSDNQYPLYVFFNLETILSQNNDNRTVFNYFRSKEFFSKFDNDTLFEYALENQKYFYLLINDNFSIKDKRDFILESIKDFTTFEQINNLLFNIFINKKTFFEDKEVYFSQIVSFEILLDTLIKEDKIKLINTLNNISFFTAYEEEHNVSMFFQKCFPFLSEEIQKNIKEKYPEKYSLYEKYALSKNLKQTSQQQISKRL